MEKETEQELIKKMIGFQKEEITSSIIYRKLAAKEKDIHNREILQRIAEDESRHYATLRGYTHQDVSPNRFEICFYVWLVHWIVPYIILCRKQPVEVFRDRKGE